MKHAEDKAPYMESLFALLRRMRHECGFLEEWEVVLKCYMDTEDYHLNQYDQNSTGKN